LERGAGSLAAAKQIPETARRCLQLRQQHSALFLWLGHGDDSACRWFEEQIRTRHPKIKIIQPQPGKAVEV
jgi:hypothetical protein